ncbi:MAG: sensor histidine kinase [Phycisphaerales bacterium]
MSPVGAGIDSAALALALIEELPAHVAVLDASGVIVATSGAWRRFQEENGGDGGACGIGANYLKVCDGAAIACRDAGRVARAIRAVAAGETDRFHHTYECSSPTERRWFQIRVQAMNATKPTDAGGSPGVAKSRLVMVVHQSITESESRAEERLARITEAAHASRLCNIGTATVELIHEITQPLASVRNYAAGSLRLLARGGPTATAELREAFEVITREVARAEEIIRRARAFAARNEASRSRFDLSAAVREVVSLWSPHLRTLGCRVETDESSGSPWADAVVTADRAQIEQVLINGLCNAADAMKSAGAGAAGAGGVGTVSGGSAQGVIEVALLHQVGVVRVEVRDRGPGISPAARRRLFEPFHTTKPSGLGMGLTISRSIAEAHSGRVDLDNRPDGVGAVFSLELPVSDAEPGREQPNRDESNRDGNHKSGVKSKESQRHAA